jgi:hypothetical protein
MKHDFAKDVLMTEVDMWAEIYTLREAIKGPEGFDSWQDAATIERIRRVAAEKELKALKESLKALIA